MEFQIHIPKAPLSDYIGSLTYFKGYDPEHTIEKLMPDGKVNIIIELDEYDRYTFDHDTFEKKKKCIRAWVSGMHQSLIAFSSLRKSSLFVIQFKAGGSFPFLHTPLHAITNLVVDAELILGKSIFELREKLMEAPSISEKFQITEQWLIKRAHYAPLPESVVQYTVNAIEKNPTQIVLKEIAEKTGYSHKQFIHIFKKQVGLTPKFYQRIIRFNKALEEINRQQAIEWPRISLDCGFYDQAHFINEFKKFSGFNPSEYLKEKGEMLHYVPVYK